MRVPAVGDVRGSDARSRLVAHVPRLAAAWAASAPEETWRVLDASVVFADISGFTALSERLARLGPAGAEELTVVLGRCFDELLAVAYGLGGGLVKFGGDALLLLFDGPGHARRAVDAAQDMRTTMRRVGRLQTSVGAVRLRMSVGVHTGDLHAFRVGSSHRELLLAGPGISTVVTMEGTASAGEVLLSPAVAAEVDPGRLGAAKGPGVLLRDRRTAGVDPIGFAERDDLDLDAVAGCVPVVLRDLILDGGGDSEHRYASIAFVHFDGVDERLVVHGAAWVAHALDELVRDVQDVAAAHDVTLLASDIDHDGGKLILVSGVPRTFGDDDGRLLRAVDELRCRPRSIPIRIGVNHGRVFAGAVGPEYRRTFTVMGDAVNLAARLMAKAQPGQVIASTGVLRGSRSCFSETPLEPFLVKGKRRPVSASLVGERVGTQERRARGTLPFVGRDAELAALDGAWATARSGRGTTVVIEGGPGLGKTRLVEELRSIAQGNAAETRVVQCEAYETSTPYFAIRVIVRALLGADDAIAGALRVAPDLEPWAPLLGDVLDVRVSETARTRDLAATHRRDRTGRVVSDLLGRLLPSPTLLVFEDVHWIDDASAAVLGRLFRDAPSRPWVIVATTRGSSPSLTVEPGSHLVLGPLALDDVRALVLAATQDAPLRPERVSALCDRASGVPLYVEELVALDDGESLPESLEEVVITQVDALPSRMRRAVLVASVLGSSFDAGLLETVGGEDTLSALPAEQLVRLPDGRLRFRHRLVRDAAYDLLPFATRRELHGRAADALAAVAADPLDRAEVRSLHCQRAGRHTDALRLAQAASRHARRRHANVEARVLLERAIDSGRRLPKLSARGRERLWEELGLVNILLNDFAAADEAFGQARRLLPDDPLVQARLAHRHAQIAEQLGREGAERYWVARGLRLLDSASPSPRVDSTRADFFVRRAALELRRGRTRPAMQWAQRALDLAEGASANDAIAAASALLDMVHVAEGRLDLATNGSRAAAIYRRAKKWDSLATIENNLGAFAYYRGDWSEALRRYESARNGFDRVGSAVDAALGSSNIAEIFADQGRLDEAEGLLRSVIDVWRSMSFPLGLARATRYLARVELRRGDAAGALAKFSEARTTFEGHGLVGNVHEVDVWSAECLLRLGRRDEADELLARCAAFEASAGPTDLAPMVHRLQAGAAAADGRLADAWAELDEALHVARSRGAAYEVALALEAFAALAELGGPVIERASLQERDELLASLGVKVAPPALVAAVAPH